MKTKLLVLALALTAGCGVNSPGTGSEVGVVIRMSKHGIFSKTWEAQIIRGGMSNGSGSFGTVPFNFTVESDVLVAKVQQYMDAGTEVKIAYRTEGLYSAMRSDSGGDFLESIEEVKR